MLSGDLRLLKEKMVRKGLCKEIKAGKNDLVCITNATAPVTKLASYWNEKRKEGEN